MFVFSEFLIDEEYFVLPNLDNVKVRFFNLMNLKKDYKIAQSKTIKESNDIEYYTDSRILKFIDQYESKTVKELNHIIENKNDFQV